MHAAPEIILGSTAYTKARLNVSILHQTIGDPAGAERHLLEALWYDPGDHRTHNQLGVLLRKRGDSAGALKCFREALRLQGSTAKRPLSSAAAPASVK